VASFQEPVVIPELVALVEVGNFILSAGVGCSETHDLTHIARSRGEVDSHSVDTICVDRASLH
jgi:hypothetical protein